MKIKNFKKWLSGKKHTKVWEYLINANDCDIHSRTGEDDESLEIGSITGYSIGEKPFIALVNKNEEVMLFGPVDPVMVDMSDKIAEAIQEKMQGMDLSKLGDSGSMTFSIPNVHTDGDDNEEEEKKKDSTPKNAEHRAKNRVKKWLENQ